MPIIEGAGSFTPGGAHYVERFRSPDLSVGTYSLAAGATDGQSPHTEDEIYLVVSGAGSFTDDAGTVRIGPGDTLFVAAGVRHHFHDIEEDLTLVVVFAPPEESRAAGP
jgi:mannose-6-phosphate isomerase-like protein (cupin superfamily)